MINFDRFELNNGLKVIVHKDTSTTIVVVNILYNVGAKDEESDKTGFAHLFEHLMFGGSVNIPKYDEPLERVGGENNAFTNNDITNYYLTLPKQNIETAFWLESDRLLSLAFSQKSLEVQRNVVIEEYKQRYLNQPYGDAWLLLKPLAYKVHPYRWATIGKEISHIENANMDDVKYFFEKYYRPNNAILTIAGDVQLSEIKKLSQKWFGHLKRGKGFERTIPVEPEQTESRKLVVKRDVPYDAIYKAFHMCARVDKEYHTVDLMSDILSNGKSSRLYVELVKKQKIFSEINAYLTGDFHKGLFVISANLIKGVKIEEAEAAINYELEKVKNELLTEYELRKVKNKVESLITFSEMKVIDKAMNLAFAELIGDASLVNHEIEKYFAVTPEKIKDQAKKVFKETNCSTLFYLSK